jgi:hypothetical protein
MFNVITQLINIFLWNLYYLSEVYVAEHLITPGNTKNYPSSDNYTQVKHR